MMIYKPSQFNYSFHDGDELIMVNFKKGLSTFTTVTGDDIISIRDYLSADTVNIDTPTEVEHVLIDNGFLIPFDTDENKEVEMLQSDYIYDNRLQLIIHVTKDCNFRCKYCFIDFEHKKMSLLLQNQVIDYIRKNIRRYSGLYISWFGGEPLMGIDVISHISEEVIEICKKAKKSYVAGITTNGYLLTPENIKKLISLKVYSYCITLDGLEESHDNQRILINGDPTFQKIINNLRYIRDNIKFRHLSMCIRTNFTKSILDNIDRYLEFFDSEFGNDKRFSLMLKLASDWGGERIETIRRELLRPYAMEKIYNCILSQKPRLSINNVTDLYHGGMTCNAVRRNKYTIGSDGIISKCDTACEETKVGYIDSSGWHFDRVKEAEWLTAVNKKGDRCITCPLRCMCFQGACPKKKLLGQQEFSCPAPAFIDRLLLLYRNLTEVKTEDIYERA